MVCFLGYFPGKSPLFWSDRGQIDKNIVIKSGCLKNMPRDNFLKKGWLLDCLHRMGYAAGTIKENEAAPNID